MTKARHKLAVSPLRRRLDKAGVPVSIDDLVATERPTEPVHCLRPAAITAAARRFLAAFPGTVLYAVKCNPEPRLLRALWAAGIRHFDCASAAEVALVRTMFPGAKIHFMHPVKARPAIAEAWRRHGVEDFVFDSDSELEKILDETGGGDAAARRGLFVRLAVDGGRAAYDLSGKFGATSARAARLLAAARPHARRLGLSFHVGSQCLDPQSYVRALRAAAAAIDAAAVPVEIVDVGGGFPARYADTAPPSLEAYMAAIAKGAAILPSGTRLWSEPGRALVATGVSVVVQIQLRRDKDLYVNDGVYGSLSDAGAPGFRFPVRLLRPGERCPSRHLAAFRLFGPTCDAADRMNGPFMLPADCEEGDWIEVGQLGAYGAALRTSFNGFDRARLVEVADPPLLVTAGALRPRFSGGAARRPCDAKENVR